MAVAITTRDRGARLHPKSGSRAFTLVELMIVVVIIGILLVIARPALMPLKGAGDMNAAAYTIADALQQARTYAMANNTYTWVGFAGSVNTPVTGQVYIAVIASNDGTRYVCTNPAGGAPLATDSSTTAAISIGTTSGTAAQIGKLTTLSNIHIGDTLAPHPDGTDFESRPSVNAAYRISSSGNSIHTFTVRQITFNRWLQFSPRGEALVNGGATQMANYAEVGVLPAHGPALAVTVDQTTNTYKGNLAAIQITGVGGKVRIYRR